MLLWENVKKMNISVIMVWDIVMVVDNVSRFLKKKKQMYVVNTWLTQNRRCRYTWRKPADA